MYEPVESVEELDTLDARAARGRTKLSVVLRIATVAMLIVCAINLVTTAFSSDLLLAARFWSVFVLLSVSLTLLVPTVFVLVVHPRALEAQRRLLADRRLLGLQSEILGAENRLVDLLSSLNPPEPRLEEILAAARRESPTLLAIAAGGDPRLPVRAAARSRPSACAAGNRRRAWRGA